MKKISIITIGKKHAATVKAGIEQYSTRIKRSTQFDWTVVPSSNAKDEGEKILKTLTKEDFCIILDEAGLVYSSEKLAELIDERMSSSDKRLVFIIGGAYGLSQKVKDRANIVWSLGKLTFPHQIVRLVIAEQIYRALTIIKGEGYHHSD